VSTSSISHPTYPTYSFTIPLLSTTDLHHSGADVSFGTSTDPTSIDTRQTWLKSFVANNLHITHAFYTHPKILVTALNGPAVGLSAALISFSDFIYAAPHTFLLTPFSSLGLVTEGNASIGFVQRLGIAKANEALIMSKRITCEELVQVGFVNKVFDVGGKDESDKFLGEVLKEVDDRLGSHLNGESLVKIKELIQKPMRATLDRQGVEEVFAGMERFMKGVPQEEFRKVASGEKKHKL
jgi:peroxisomal 3,2-trans-enoyl-CoA isomerase